MSDNEEFKEPKQEIHSSNSGAYDPGPMEDAKGLPTGELSLVQAHNLDLALEEFAEGPYGAATNETKLGKVSEWKEGQAFSPRYKDTNLLSSDRKVPFDEPPFDASEGSIEGQN